ncbi:MAG: peptidoglycan-binding protein, partial [Aristaeellaceae bacterium]
TKDAVRAFQMQNNLSPVDGIAGNKTLQKLYSSSAIAASTPNTNYTTLEKGDKGDLVVQLQDCLVQLGYMSTRNGVYDDTTVEAVKNFQRYNGLTVDGKAGAETQKKLFSDSAVAYPGP